MMENHSFDHIFGYSAITGTDASTGKPTTINGLTGNETNSYNNVKYPVQKVADDCMPSDPGHEFTDTVEQLCGQGTQYPSGGPYPPIKNSGFVSNYATTKTEGTPPTDNFGEIMKCYDTKNQLPIIYQLATEFAICDNWFSALPGPTWPNRFFVHGASSNGLDHSPTIEEIALWQTLEGFSFPKGSIFESLKNKDIPWRLYNDDQKCFLGGQIPIVSALKGISHVDVHSFDDFENDLQNNYPAAFTFIEPNYGDIIFNTYKGGSSQHPMDDITSGESFIKATYEAIRKSPVWDSSLLIITYDEHGGFYDHVKPPSSFAPNDGSTNEYNQYGFDFKQYGIRVPAVIVSPLIPKNIIDHTQYDHASALKTIEKVFDVNSLTDRDKNANSLIHLMSLSIPRTDCPVKLNEPSEHADMSQLLLSDEDKNNLANSPLPKSGTLRGVLHITLKTEFQLSDKTEETRKAILENYKNIKTRGDAKNYIDSVMVKLNAERANKK